jgi:hypothetical protein
MQGLLKVKTLSNNRLKLAAGGGLDANWLPRSPAAA